MTDRELLELAAKATGTKLQYIGCMRWFGNQAGWNPLADDGDALRLAVKCNLWIGQHDDGVTVSDAYARFRGALEEDYNGEPYAATRRAIVLAAAEIGKTK